MATFQLGTMFQPTEPYWPRPPFSYSSQITDAPNKFLLKGEISSKHTSGCKSQRHNKSPAAILKTHLLIRFPQSFLKTTVFIIPLAASQTCLLNSLCGFTETSKRPKAKWMATVHLQYQRGSSYPLSVFNGSTYCIRQHQLYIFLQFHSTN